LLVDDDEQFVGLLDIRLTKAGYLVTPVTRARLAYHWAMSGVYDLIVLDIVMPEMNGVELCAALRAQGILTPILVLSGQTETDMVVRALNAGADDYLTKPFNDYELMARLRALMRRNRKAFTSHVIERSGVVLDISGRTIRHGKRVLSLTRKETLLLKRLMSEAPEPVARLGLLQDVWGVGDHHASNRLDVYIRRLRIKLAELDSAATIQTLRSSGYYFGEPTVASKVR